MSPATAWFWRIVALVLFIAFMVGFTWGWRQVVEAMPPMLIAALFGLMMGGGAGFLIGADYGRKQASRHEVLPPR